MLLSTRKKRKKLNAEGDSVKAEKQDCVAERDQLSRRLEDEEVQEAVAIASKENPELVKRWFALEEIEKEWRRRDILKLDLEHKQERQREQGPELGFKKELGRSDDGIENGRGRERKGTELEL